MSCIYGKKIKLLLKKVKTLEESGGQGGGQNYVTVAATDQTTSVTDILPATGEANTIYRVGNWNGTQYDPTMYALFAWNGSAYVCLAFRSFVGEVYDVSVNHPDGLGNPTPYADLAAAIGTSGANIPADIRRGGMSIKFIQGTVQSSDNKYIQARCMAQNFTTDVTQWQGVDDEPTAGSDNLVKSGGVAPYSLNAIPLNSVCGVFTCKSNEFTGGKKVSNDSAVGQSVVIVDANTKSGYYRIPVSQNDVLVLNTRSDLAAPFVEVDENNIVLIKLTKGITARNYAYRINHPSTKYLLCSTLDYLEESYIYNSLYKNQVISQIADSLGMVSDGLLSNPVLSNIRNNTINNLSENYLRNGGYVPLELYYHVGVLLTGNVGEVIQTIDYTYNDYRLYQVLYKIPCKYKDVFKVLTRRDSNHSIYITDTNDIILKIITENGVKHEEREIQVINENAAYIYIPDAGYDGYSFKSSYVKRVNSNYDIVLYNPYSDGFETPNSFSFAGTSTHVTSGGAITFTNIDRLNIYSEFNSSGKPALKDGHKYYVSMYMTSSKNNYCLRYGYPNLSITGVSKYVELNHSGSGNMERLSFVFNNDAEMTFSILWLYKNIEEGSSSADEVTIQAPLIVDLTDAFGVGNEPSKDFMDAYLRSLPHLWFSDLHIYKQSTGFDFYEGLVSNVKDLDVLCGNETNNPTIVEPSMSTPEFIEAYNNNLDTYANLCMCNRAGFLSLNTTMTEEELCIAINNTFKDNVVNKEMSSKTICDRINLYFTKKVQRFCDAKLPTGPCDFSLTASSGYNMQEPSAIISSDGNTLYVYGHIYRISTTDGVNWSTPESLVFDGGPYTMHKNVNIIDGVYYLIGTEKTSAGDLHLFTSTDGINFTYRGVIFKNGHPLGTNHQVGGWGNTSIFKEIGSNKYYLYYECIKSDSSSGGDWVICLATCTDLFTSNQDGTIGNWVDCNENPILGTNKPGGGARGNVDFPKDFRNTPIKYDGKYYMYCHGSTFDRIYNRHSAIFRLYSYDLIHWVDEGEIFNNRDIPVNGANFSGNADHCIIEFKNRTYLFYSLNINSRDIPITLKYTIDDRPLIELLAIRP